MQQTFGSIGAASQMSGINSGPLGQTPGYGTTNQQKLKSHVQQFMSKMRKDSDIFYKQFIAFCKSHKEIERWSEFHEGIGKMLQPYGDFTGEINKMLHSDFQFEILESSANKTLRGSEIGTDNVQEKDDKRKYTKDSQIYGQQQQSQQQQPIANQKEIVREKFQMVCLIIKQDCPDKMNEFVSALQMKLNGQEDQLRLFIQTCRDIFGEDHQISHKVEALFQEQMAFDSALETQAAQQQQQQNQLLLAQGKSTNSQNDTIKSAKELKKSRQGKGQNNTSNNFGNTQKDQAGTYNSSNAGIQSNNGQQGSSAKGTLTPNGISSVQANSSHYRVPSTRGGDIISDFPHSTSRVALGADGKDQIPLVQQKNPSFPGITKSEQNFLYLTDNHMDPMAFMNMLKLLYLYVECIITASEMVEQGTYLLQGFQNPDKFIEQLKDLVECRENSRRRATPYFKPLNDLDFNTHERFTHSYVQMPRFYPKYCSNSTPLTKSILNTQIVTVPQGTEHVTFSIMRKNQYEEQLFKSEDEKYEFDHHIQMYRRTIKTMEKIETCEDPVECKALMQLAIDLKMIICLYKHGSPEQQEICDILLSNPKKTVGVTLERMRIKLKEIEDAKANQAKKQWHEVAEKNFHRSLDHRSFIFKRHDRKFTLSSRFEKEPEFRNKILQKSSAINKDPVKPVEVIQALPSRTAGSALGSALKNAHLEDGVENAHDFETDPANYFQFLNSFQGTTTIEKCSHSSSNHLLHSFDYLKEPRKFTLPIMSFIFEDEDICIDTFSLLMHYLLTAPLNASEREKIKRTTQIVLKGLFGFTFTAIEQSDIVLNENKTIKIATDIENKIFEKIFAYLRPNARQEDENQGKEGDIPNEGEEDEKEDKQAADDQEDTNQDGKTHKEDGNSNNNNTKGKKRPKSPSRMAGTLSTSKKNLKDHEIETEDDKKHGKHPHEHGHSDSSLDEMLDEEGSKETIREMSYCHEKVDENVYQPKRESEDMESFYGTKNLYIFIRFFYVLYERLFKASEISKSFEDNEKTRLLSDEEKEELAKERYSAFKTILVGSLKARDTKYEDYLRSIFGKQAFLLFTIDKTLQSTVKSLQTLASDDLSNKLLALYVFPDEQFKHTSALSQQEETTYAKINKIILDSTNKPGAPDHRSFFRFTRVKGCNILYLNYIDSYYKNWDIEQIQSTKDYFKSFTTSQIEQPSNMTPNSETPVFLNRNKRKNQEKLSQRTRQVIQQNNIEFVAFPNTSHLLSANAGKEDVLLSVKRKAVSLENLIEVEIQKKIKFDAWYAQCAEGVIHYKQNQTKKPINLSQDKVQIPINEISTISNKNNPQDPSDPLQP